MISYVSPLPSLVDPTVRPSIEIENNEVADSDRSVRAYAIAAATAVKEEDVDGGEDGIASDKVCFIAGLWPSAFSSLSPSNPHKIEGNDKSLSTVMTKVSFSKFFNPFEFISSMSSEFDLLNLILV